MYDALQAVSLAAVVPDGSRASLLADTGRPIGSISIQRVTAGASFFIRIGNAQWIPISGPCVFYGFDPIKEGILGAFFRNDVAQAGASFDAVIGYISDRDYAQLRAQQ